jgi:radical SAM protein with 4Fe4S-binding SPASM domain
MITNRHLLKWNSKVIFRELDNKLFLFNEDSQNMLCLNSTGNIIWQLINKKIRYDILLKKIQLSNIDISEKELRNFVKILLSNNMLFVNNDPYNKKNETINFETMELWRFIHKHTGNYYPVTVTWEITYKCNQTCIHCYEDCNFTKNMQDLDIESIRNILLELHKNGCFILNITGGEPFIRKDLFEILRIAKELNFSISLYSNASLITDSDISKIAEIGISKMCITLFSIDSDRHDKIANKKGLHSKTFKNIIKLRQIGVPIRINTPLTKYNFDGYREIVAFAKQMDCELIITPTMTPKDDGNMSPLKLSLDDSQFETILLDTDINVELEDDKISLNNKLESVPCNVVFSGLAISANGNVYPCNTFKLECGNLVTQSLLDIWLNSEVLSTLRTKRIKQIKECNICSQLDFCLPCPAYSWLENNEITGKSSISCRTASIRQRLDL